MLLDTSQLRQGSLTGHGVVWIDLEAQTDWETLAETLDALNLPGYDRAMLGHLLQGVGPSDFGAEQVPWYSRSVASKLNTPGFPAYLEAFGLHAEISPGPYEPPWVFNQPVRFLVGGLWLITNRLEGRASDGIYMQRADPVPRDQLSRYARRRWQRYVDPGDLAILLLRALVETYRPAIAALDRRLQDLQQGYVRGRGDPGGSGNLDEVGYREGLLQVKWAVDGLSRSMLNLSRPATAARGAWFPVRGAIDAAEEISELLDRAEQSLTRLRDELRESFALIAASQASEQLTISREIQQAASAADERSRRFEIAAQYVAAAFVLPALVAQVLGGLPAIFEDCPSLRALVVAGGTGASIVVSVAALFFYRRFSNKA